MDTKEDDRQGPEVVGIYEDVYAEAGFGEKTVPATPFKSILDRGGNNPDGGFLNNFVSVD
ncbi:hypothetical protein EBT25_06820 [bacterium]|nr:hypothetical protein [bacterium]